MHRFPSAATVPGAFWQDRHHAVAVDTYDHLWRCLFYVDRNKTRARVRTHARNCHHAGHNEIQYPRSRYRIIDLERLAALTGCASVGELQRTLCEQVEAALNHSKRVRDPIWTEAIAVGRKPFIETVRPRLGRSRLQRIRLGDDGESFLREPEAAYISKDG